MLNCSPTCSIQSVFRYGALDLHKTFKNNFSLKEKSSIKHLTADVYKYLFTGMHQHNCVCYVLILLKQSAILDIQTVAYKVGTERLTCITQYGY